MFFRGRSKRLRSPRPDQRRSPRGHCVLRTSRTGPDHAAPREAEDIFAEMAPFMVDARRWMTRVKRSIRGSTANDSRRHNLLTRMTRSHDPQSGVARRRFNAPRRRERLIVVPQNLYEFWAVAPSAWTAAVGRNGLGMTAVQAGHWLRFFRRRFTLLPDVKSCATFGRNSWRGTSSRVSPPMTSASWRRCKVTESLGCSPQCCGFRGLPL